MKICTREATVILFSKQYLKKLKNIITLLIENFPYSSVLNLTKMKKRKLQHRLEFWLIVFFAGIFRLLPHKWAVCCGMSIGGFAYKRLKIRRNVALSNLKIAFPQKTLEELEDIAYRSYRHWGGVGAEFARLPLFNRKHMDKYITFTGQDVLNNSVALGKGGLIISGHFGNWEVMGPSAVMKGYGVTYIVATQTNKLVDKKMDDLRKDKGIEIWKTREAPRGVFKSLKNNSFIAIMIDQDAGKDCVFVDFFSKSASTHRGPAVFHLRTGAPLIKSSCIRTKGPYYTINFEEIILPESVKLAENVTKEMMAYLTGILEEQIKEHPEQYFWMHKRWKTRPV